MTVSVPPSAPAAPVPKHSLVLILAFLSAFGPLTTDMYLPAFGEMAQDFGVDQGRIQATLTAFFAGMAAGQLLYGPVLDRWGRRLPLLAGVALFLLATLGCLLSPDIESFSFFRVLQAVGGCAGMIVARAVVSDLFDPQETARTLSLLMMVVTLAPAVAPVLGSWILLIGGWRAIFAVLLLYGLACLLLAWKAVPETLAPERRRPISLRGMLQAYGSLLGQRAFVLPALIGGLGLAALFCYITGSAFALTSVYGLSAQQYGLLFGLNALGIMVTAQVNRMLLRHWSTRQALGFGLALSLGACVLALVAATWMPGQLLPFALGLAGLVATVGFIGSNSAALAMVAGRARAGSASALLGTVQFVCAALFSGAVAAAQNGTVYPMLLGMLTASLLAGLLWLAARPGPGAAAGHGTR
jgi:DHA1 family bicyclomycin/chloramphenicol resistance-like MFS transporter